MNLFGIWKNQNVEQVRLVPVPTLPASETIKIFFKNMIYWLKNEKMKATLDSQIVFDDCFNKQTAFKENVGNLLLIW